MEFSKWLLESQQIVPFPGSTVPYLVYHGTKKRPFDKFSIQKSKRYVLFSEFDVETQGFFFFENPHDAVEFGPNVVSCYIDLKKPLLDPRRDKHLGIDQLDLKHEIDLQKILAPIIEKDKYGHFIDLGVQRYYLKGGMNWIYNAVGGDGLDWDALDKPGVVDRMKKLGYDGTFVSEPDTHIGRSIFVVSPEQVRLVGWVKGPQDEWGDKDDYYTTKQNGFNNFYGPNNPKPS